MMKARLFVVVGSALAGMVMSASAASAGGWAMSSLDPMSVPVTGQETEVGSTIRQHGVTPVNPDDEGREPVAVAVRSASGDEAVFPARQQGPTGHYDAEVIFPEAGQAHWEIRQGWFGPQDLGAIDVAEARSGVGGAGAADTDGTMADYRWPLARAPPRLWWQSQRRAAWWPFDRQVGQRSSDGVVRRVPDQASPVGLEDSERGSTAKNPGHLGQDDAGLVNVLEHSFSR
jgi:hypothetical protein